jgi:adenosylcobinamide-GDP ribazoletransferase
MQGTGTKPTRDPSSWPWWFRDLVLAAGFLTRLPVPTFDPEGRELLRTGWCFPLVGAAIGILGGILVWGSQALGLPVFACALVALAGTALLTGALHEDGLADLADGFGGGRDKAAKITIMRDSRIGGYGVLALVYVTGLKASAIATLMETGDTASVIIAMIAAHACARGLIVPVTLWLPNANDGGVGKMAGQPKPSTVQITMAICGGLLVILLPLSTAVAAGAAGCVAAVAVATLARHQIAGYTGDVLGAVEQAAETAVLLALASAVAT